MADFAHNETDKMLVDLEKKIKAEYTKAYKEIKTELQSVVSKLDLNPEMSPLQRLELMNKKGKLENLAKMMTDVIKNANEEAVKYINNSSVNVYKLNHDYAHEQMKFAVMDKTAVKNLLSDKANPFTKLAIDAEKDGVAIRKKLTSELTTSILKGESIPQMAKRIKGVTERNLADSVRIARTETTRVENMARFDVGKQGEEHGFIMKKRWVATSDNRTRTGHAEVNGQVVGLNEPFEVKNDYTGELEQLMYPGDWSLGASPENTINCRCIVVNIVVGKDNSEDIELQKQGLADIKKDMAKLETKKYEGIWRDQTVTVKDYLNKKESIPSKISFYERNIGIAKSQGLEETVQLLTEKLELVKEYQQKGEEYVKLQEEKDKAEKMIAKLIKQENVFNTDFTNKVDLFSQEEKDKALWFDYRKFGYNEQETKRQANARFSPEAYETWQNATLEEKRSIVEYTRSFSKFNEPLRGIEYYGGYKGVGNVDLNEIGVKQGYFSRGQVKKQIEAMTSIIDKSISTENTWLNRGVRYDGMDKFFNIDMSLLRNATESQLKDALMDNVYTEYAFLSTSSYKGGGFSSYPIIFNVYTPQGTPMMYVENISYYGQDYGVNWAGQSGDYFGREFETIIQRGAQLKVTKVEKSGGKWYIDFDLVGFDRETNY